MDCILKAIVKHSLLLYTILYCISGNRTPQNLMTTVPERVWTGAIVPYKFNLQIGKLSMYSNINVLLYNIHAYYVVHSGDTQINIP